MSVSALYIDSLEEIVKPRKTWKKIEARYNDQ